MNTSSCRPFTFEPTSWTILSPSPSMWTIVPRGSTAGSAATVNPTTGSVPALVGWSGFTSQPTA